MRKRPKETYSSRRKSVRETLIVWGMPEKVVKKVLNPSHKLGDLEKIVRKTEKKKPGDPVKYFLKGLNYYREKHGEKPLYRSLSK